jgi:glucokinase
MNQDMIGAVDIGATKTLVGLADAGGRLTGRTLRFDTPPDPHDLVGRLVAALTDLGRGRRPSIVGCVTPSPVQSCGEVLLSVHNRGWVEVPLARLMESAMDAPVLLGEDATAAALGEAVSGAGAGRDPVVFVTVSSGIGAGVVVGGVPLRGARGVAGEIGHLVLDPEGPPCGCGRRGDVEAYAGGVNLVRRAVELWRGDDPPRTAREVFAAAGRGDERAGELLDSARWALSRAFAALAAVVDPEVFVVGGSIALGQPAWLDDVIRDARELCMAEAGRTLTAVPAALGEESCLAGAALMAASRVAAR